MRVLGTPSGEIRISEAHEGWGGRDGGRAIENVQTNMFVYGVVIRWWGNHGVSSIGWRSLWEKVNSSGKIWLTEGLGEGLCEKFHSSSKVSLTEGRVAKLFWVQIASGSA